MKSHPNAVQLLTSEQPQRIHLIGVAGSGMSGLAGLLLALGHHVSGSDKVDSGEVKRLQTAGLKFHCPHEAQVVRDAAIVIYSSAVKVGNPAYDEALRLGKTLLRRAEALAGIMSMRRGIIVAGMHGKTTTSSMAAHVLRAGGLHPCHYVGAEIPILGTNAHWDPEGEFFVAEGDESDGTIALFEPEHTIVLNIEEEHLDYYADLSAIETVFRRLLDQTAGSFFYCIDDANTRRLCEGRAGGISFGADRQADYRYDLPRTENFQSQFEVYRRGALLGTATLNVPGRHNVSNATSVIALACELGVEFSKVVAALTSFRGASRRFEFKHRGPGFSVVDDYAHHPSEIRATIETARAGHPGRIVTVFQPHRYTRTQALGKQFGAAFDHADVVFVTGIYAASERAIEGVSGQLIVDAIAEHQAGKAFYEPDFGRVAARIGSLLKPGDLLVSLGAGNIHEVARQLVREIVILEEIQNLLQSEGEASLYEPMSAHTTLRVGGPAKFWVEPTTEAAFARLVRYADERKLPIFVVGRGSNLLVRDGGIDGLVIHPNKGEFAALNVHPSTCEITAGAAVGLKRLSGAAAVAGIGGFEWMDGIPGALGGSLRMNAGAMGVESFDQVTQLRLLDRTGTIREALPAELEVRYRSVPSLRQEFVLSATLKGVPSTGEAIKELLSRSSAKRKASQPIAASAGCIFKNPSKDCPAGRLVQELGLKNVHVGAARMSEVHGNFIVNDGGKASADDVLALIEIIKKAALDQRGVVMETEVQIVGQDQLAHPKLH